MIAKFINLIGHKTIHVTLSYFEAMLFASLSIINIFIPSNYTSNIYTLLIKQIYQTSIKAIPQFILMAAIFGSIVIGLLIVIASDFNLQIQIGSIIVNFAIKELAPLLTAFFIAYLFSPLIYMQASLLNLKSQTQALHDVIIPRILSTIISTITLSILFSMIMLASGYLFVFFIMGMDVHTYEYLIFSSFDIYNIFILLTKSSIFGFIVAVIPLYNGLITLKPKHTTSKIFVILFFIEFLSLFIQKATNAI
ncbi:ABC transporter permease [Sulfurimonas sp.]|nr:ABC transporter permease [Sulfurimonas sp.]